MLCRPFPSQQLPCCTLLGLALCKLRAGRAPSAHAPRIPPRFPSRHSCGHRVPCPALRRHREPGRLAARGLRSRGGVRADPAGSGDVGRVWLGGAALRAHGAGPQPLHHRAVRLQGGRLPLLRELGGSAAAHAPHRHLLPAPGVLPPALLRPAPCPGGLRGASRPHPAHALGTAACSPAPLSVLLPFAAVCIVCAILQHLRVPWDSLDAAAARFPWANSTFHPPWLQLPYSGEWPLLTPRALAVGIAMAVGCSVNSAGCYVLCGRLLRAPRPPQHACNRGLCAEGLGSLLAGLLGAAGGTAASIANTCAGGLTQDGSRLSVQVSALACVALGMSPRLAGLLTRIPLAVHGGVLCVTYAVAVGTGISYFQHADIDSGRNIFIVGFTMFMALLVPRWLGAAPAHLATGWVPLDLLFLSLLTVPVFLTGFLSFFLENTVSGTPEERGLPQKAGAGDGERGEASPVYALPAGLSRLLPSCKAFPCCFLCPGHEEEEEEEKEEEDGEDGCRAAEEGVVAAGEGTRLLLKPGTGEAQDREPSQAETLAWHTGA
ncbi:solute carrier family 23 member 3 isoform X1 [Anser cygnoides]|uniref:solute carrier family 23 member 3 isoform X1 n=1 Tax=Anser cygnoides TaxID=8845 RepID=UPI0034D32A00